MKSGLYKRLYWPICRAYARYVLDDRPADAIYRSLCALDFWRSYGYWPSFVHPRRFSEKLWSRMLHVRDPRLTVLSDKLRVRDYVAAKAGPGCLIPLLWSGENPEHIPFGELPRSFVIKASHGCRFNILVKDKGLLDLARTRLQLAEWRGQNYCQDYRLGTEWGYKNITPSILVESFLEDDGKVPMDYKFWCFGGRVECITLHFDRFENHRVRTLDRSFNPYEYPFPLDNGSGEYSRPDNFENMRNIAESLADGFGFVRVDLYNVQGQIYFGEMTPYPGGIRLLLTAKADCVLGEKWDGQ